MRSIFYRNMLVVIILGVTFAPIAAGKVIPSAEQAKEYAHPEEHADVITLVETDWVLELPEIPEPPESPVVPADGKTIPALDNGQISSNATPYDYSPVINPDWTLTVPYTNTETETVSLQLLAPTLAPTQSEVISEFQFSAPMMVVPEPSTIILLTLGGLLIRKK